MSKRNCVLNIDSWHGDIMLPTMIVKMFVLPEYQICCIFMLSSITNTKQTKIIEGHREIDF